MAEKPANEKLYSMVVNQAKAKYQTYPSPGASHWVHKRYLELGGRFVDAGAEADKKKRQRAWLDAHHAAHGSKLSKRERFLKYHYNKHNKRD